MDARIEQKKLLRVPSDSSQSARIRSAVPDRERLAVVEAIIAEAARRALRHPTSTWHSPALLALTYARRGMSDRACTGRDGGQGA
jgi:hypothetical protein